MKSQQIVVVKCTDYCKGHCLKFNITLKEGKSVAKGVGGGGQRPLSHFVSC